MRNSAIFSIISGWLFLFLVLSFQAAPALAAGSTAAATFAADFTITGSATGPLSKLTVTATVQVASADAGKNGVVYVMANIANMWFFKGAGGSWALWNGGPFPAPYLQGALNSHAIPVVENMDLGLFPGTEFYVGYGLGQAEQGQADMVANGKYRKLAASPTTPLAGTWTMASVTGPFFDNTPQTLVVDANGTMIHIGLCSFSAAYTVNGNTLLVSVTANNGSADCGSDDVPGTAHSFTYTLSGDTLALTAKDGSVATFKKFTGQPPSTLQYTASGTYTYSAGTGTVNWANSSFPSDCDGPAAGKTDTFTITSITSTTMVWQKAGDWFAWTRSSGTAGDITGTWSAADPKTGNALELTVNSDGTVSMIGHIVQCGSGGNPTEEYSVWAGMSRKMTAAGMSTDMVLHIHAWAPQNTLTRIALNGPSLNRTVTPPWPWTDVRNGVTVDGFVSDESITRTPQVNDTYTFTVTKTDSTTFTRTQSLSRVLLDAPQVTSPAGHALADANLGQALNLAWTIPAGVLMENIHIGGQVCNPSGCTNVDGTATSATTGTINLPVMDKAATASIDIRVHYGRDVFMSCWYEFR